MNRRYPLMWTKELDDDVAVPCNPACPSVGHGVRLGAVDVATPEPSMGAEAESAARLAYRLRVGAQCVVGVLALWALRALCGDNSEVHDPQPGESRAWMGERMQAQVAQEVGR